MRIISSYFILAVLSVQLLVACSGPKGQKPSSDVMGPIGRHQGGDVAGQGGGTGKTPLNPAQGTSDPGSGGNGIAGKPYESYIRDPRTLPAYEKHLKAFFDNIARKNKEIETEEEKKIRKPEFSDMFRTKTWYFVPSELTTLPSDVVGVSQLKESTQQIARQYKKSIWVNDLIFAQMDSEAQADLLLHEVVEIMYLMKGMKLSDYCEIQKRLGFQTNATIGNKEVPCSALDEFDAVERTPIQHLTAVDYENIRSATNWIKKNGATTSLKDFYIMMLAHGFDDRMFNQENAEQEQPPTKRETTTLTMLQMFEALERARVTGRLPRLCRPLGSQQEIPCELSYRLTTESFLPNGSVGSKVEALTLELKSAQGLIFQLKSFGQNEISENTAWNQKVYQSWLMEAVPTPKIGLMYTNMIISWEKSATSLRGKETYEIVSAAFVPGVLTEFDQNGCRGELPQGEGAPSVMLLLNAQRKASDSTSILFSSGYLKQLASCPACLNLEVTSPYLMQWDTRK
ncbi:MAG: hypothetical protein KF865_13115 [Bdellovibrionaceae bacterium]|nr:hypothetical protein [Pseudobdellovibrionaceae bacterium]